MKNTLLKTLLLGFACLMFTGALQAQTCTVDPQYTSPGIYPSDTMPDLYENVAYNHVVQFVFPSDTTVFGFNLTFDSFLVTSVSNLPQGIQWECNQNHPTCNYISAPPALTRGCVKIYDTPTAPNPAYPGYDSVIVTGEGWVDVPFVGPTPVAQDIPIYYRVHPGNSTESELEAALNLQVTPNPVAASSRITYMLPEAGDVKVGIYDVYGREVVRLFEGYQAMGEYGLPLRQENLADGVYFLRFELNDGAFVTTEKIVSFK